MSGNSGVTTPTMQEQDSTEQEPPSTPQKGVVAFSPARNSSINNNPPPSRRPSCLSVQQSEETRALIAEILEQAKNEIFKAFGLGISSEKNKENAQEQEEDHINTPPDHEAHKPSPRNLDSLKPLSELQLTPEKGPGSVSSPSHPTPEAMAKRVKRRLKFFEHDEGGQRKRKKIEETVPGAEGEQPFLDLSAYPFLREPLKVIGFVNESIPNVIERSKLKELEDKWINLWEEQMQLSLKLSELILELRKLFGTEAINPSSTEVLSRRSQFGCFVLRTMKGSKGKGATSKEALKSVDDRKVGKRKAAAKVGKSSTRKAKKVKKDPNKPKRPASAFFVFLEEFRKTFKKENPHVTAVSAVGKAAGEKWKSMSPDEKAPYEAKAAKGKAEYEKLMNAYNKKQEKAADDGDEESDKSKSEVNDEEEDEANGEEEHQPTEEEEEEVEEEEEEEDDEDDD